MSVRRDEVIPVIVTINDSLLDRDYQEAGDRAAAAVRRLALLSLIPCLASLLIMLPVIGMYLWKAPLPPAVAKFSFSLSAMASALAILSGYVRNFYADRRGLDGYPPLEHWGYVGAGVAIGSTVLAMIAGAILGWL